MAEPIDPDDFEYAWRVIRHRCGDGIADLVVPVSMLEQVIEVLDVMAERVEALQGFAGGQVEAGIDNPRRGDRAGLGPPRTS
jgi:hypothetical protein